MRMFHCMLLCSSLKWMDGDARSRWSSRRRFPELRAHAAIEDLNDGNDNDQQQQAAATRNTLPSGVMAIPKPKKL
jgi:hypothetical protein